MDISAVVVSFNSGKFLAQNLDSLFRQTPAFKQVIVVDNRSGDDSAAVIASYPGAVKIISESNLGYAAAANLGIRRSDADLVLVANADIYLADDFNRQVIGVFTTRPQTAMLSPLLLRFDRRTIDSAGQAYSLALHPREIGFNQKMDRVALRAGEVFSVCGAATVFSRSGLEKLKLGAEYYDEDFFMFWEDFDIGWRANLLGLKVFFAPQAVAYHFRSGTLKKTWLARFSLALSRPAPLRFHLVKNRYLTLIKNFRLARFWWALPFILIKDLLWVCALTITAPKIIIAMPGARASFRRAFKKRRQLQRHE
ncbi:MAG TPA: glycosyltransferase family 2 protein [Candidatus Binatia bacterium]|nr:glycosyltransferase family 2 protein [Candidatus Binatia bacterium]